MGLGVGRAVGAEAGNQGFADAPLGFESTPPAAQHEYTPHPLTPALGLTTKTGLITLLLGCFFLGQEPYDL